MELDAYSGNAEDGDAIEHDSRSTAERRLEHARKKTKLKRWRKGLPSGTGYLSYLFLSRGFFEYIITTDRSTQCHVIK
jgi:hypothetical protein